MYFYVYKTTNLLNNKIYVGKHVSQKDNDDYFGSGFLLCRSIEKNGIENFKKEIIEYCNSKKELEEREKFWIRELNSFQPNGYNIAEGGNGGDLYTHNPKRAEIIEKLREKGKKISPEHKIALVTSRLGKSHTKEAREKISKVRKGMIFTETHKKNISEKTKEGMKGIELHNQRKIDCYDSDGTLIKTTESMAEAARTFNICYTSVHKVCQGLRKTAKGMKFIYHN